MFLTLLGKTETTNEDRKQRGDKIRGCCFSCCLPHSFQVSSHFSVLSYGLLRHDQRGDSRNWQWKHVHGLKNESVCIHSVKAAVRWLISSRMASKWKCCRWSYVVIGPLQLPSPPGQAIKHVKQNDAILKINCGGPCHRILRGCSRCF